jgi:hypothetical protein
MVIGPTLATHAQERAGVSPLRTTFWFCLLGLPSPGRRLAV